MSDEPTPKPTRTRRRTAATTPAAGAEAPKPARTRRAAAPKVPPGEPPEIAKAVAAATADPEPVTPESAAPKPAARPSARPAPRRARMTTARAAGAARAKPAPKPPAKPAAKPKPAPAAARGGTGDDQPAEVARVVAKAAGEEPVKDSKPKPKKGGKTAKAIARLATKAAEVAAPERIVVDDPPPAPDYPRYRVEPGRPVRLADIDPGQSERFKKKKDVAKELARQRARIADLQARLYAEDQRSLLIVLQAMDTGGKDGTIKGVFQGVNPQGCQVWSFKVPSGEEADHDFLWRYHNRTPAKGMIGIFNRSHYEDVLVVRVKELVPEAVWRPRYETINRFEQALTLSGITVLKFFLHISKDEQKRRLEARLDDPDKRWKFAVGDIAERKRWDDYQAAYEDALNECSTSYAPWYIVPANKKFYRNLVIARTIADTLEALDPRYPRADPGLKGIKIPD
jgi:PPK2 family polyphosphate:nucleotide phosphotransferase